MRAALLLSCLRKSCSNGLNSSVGSSVGRAMPNCSHTLPKCESRLLKRSKERLVLHSVLALLLSAQPQGDPHAEGSVGGGRMLGVRCSGCIPAKGRIASTLQEMSPSGRDGWLYLLHLSSTTTQMVAINHPHHQNQQAAFSRTLQPLLPFPTGTAPVGWADWEKSEQIG